MAAHERESCDGAHECPTCGITVQREELLSNSHSCVGALTRYLYKAIDEKDQVINNLREELERKNQVLIAFMHKQTHLEQRLQRIQEVLNFDDADEDFLEEEQKRNEALAEDQEELKVDAESIVPKRRSLEPEVIAEEGLPNFLEMYFPNGTQPPIDHVMNYSLTVPDEVREHFIYLQQCFPDYIAFMKHP